MLEPGTKLGRYTVRELLGSGGMGEVYRSNDERLHRDVAIKVLPVNFASDHEARERFEREARAVASLSHPNILAIYDVGSEGDIHYAVTELLEGETLRRRIDAGPLDAREALALMLQIAEGVAAAHARGLVHRDLKPENIFITKSGRVKVLDFGLARTAESLLDPYGHQSSALTTPGMIIGTVAYLAPEVVQAKPPSPASDVYALGCVLFEMLEKRPPFDGESVLHTLAVIAQAPAPALSGRDDPLVRAIDALVDRCLAKDPSERPADAGELASEVGALLQASPTARIVTRPRRRRSRHVMRAIGALMIVAVAAALIVAYVRDRNRVIDSGFDLRASDVRGDGETRRLVGLAMQSDAIGDRGRATELLEEAHRRSPETALPAAFLSSWAAGAGDWPRYSTWTIEATRRLRGDTPPYESLLVRYFTAERQSIDRRLALANSLLAMRPAAWRLHLGAAHHHFQRREEGAALRELQKVDVSKPDDRKLTLVLADRASLGDIDGAERDLRRSRLVNRPPFRDYTQGRIEWSRGDTLRSIADFTKSADEAAVENLAPIEIDSRMFAGLGLLRRGEWESARRVLGAANTRARQAGITYRVLDTSALAAYACWKMSDFEERDRKLAEAQQLADDAGDHATLRILAIRIGSDLWRLWPPPDPSGDPAALPGVPSLIAAYESWQAGRAADARQQLHRARVEGIELTGLREEAELLSADLGEPFTLLRPDPPYPTVIRLLAIFELAARRPPAPTRGNGGLGGEVTRP